jgi:hypothetical protein
MKAEENAWNATILQLATAMMPGHPNAKLWMTKNVELMLSAFARPEDVGSGPLFHGKPLFEWLGGSNINSDGTLVNHRRIHPDYMATVTQNLHAALVYPLARMPTPKAAFFNADVVYRALTDVAFPHPLHAEKVREMQSRHPDGRTYAAPIEDKYRGREEWIALHAGQAYLAKWIRRQNVSSAANDGVERWLKKRGGGAGPPLPGAGSGGSGEGGYGSLSGSKHLPGP